MRISVNTINFLAKQGDETAKEMQNYYYDKTDQFPLIKGFMYLANRFWPCHMGLFFRDIGVNHNWIKHVYCFGYDPDREVSHGI